MKVSNNIEQLIPYKPGKSIEATKSEYGLTQVYKLASNESAVGLSDKVIQAIQAELSELHRYPDPNCTKLKEVISKKYDVGQQNVVVGNGSNELIDLLIRTFCIDGDQILTSESAFIAYKICAKAANVSVVEVPLTDSLTYDVNALIKKLDESSGFKIIFVANPNNPTGTYISHEKIELLLQHVQNNNDAIVVLDEAYNDFVRADDFPDSSLLLKKYDNLVILKTLSKVFGLAGLRVGYLVAKGQICDYINRIRNPFNVNSLAQVAALTALNDSEFIEEAQKVNWQGLDYFYNELTKMSLTYWESQANFVLVDTGFDSQLVFNSLLKVGVITRPVKAYGLPTHLRISVGTEKENAIVMNELKKVLNELRSHN